MFKFQEGASVAVKNNSAALGLVAGDTGIVWALYDTQPPAYEVVFRPSQGDEFSLVLNEEELLEPAAPAEPALRKKRALEAAKSHAHA